MSQEPWTDEDEYSSATRSPSAGWRYGPKDRVVLGGKGLAMGIAVAHLTFCALWGIQAPGWAIIVFLYSLLPVWAIGAAVGSLLGLALRRVRNQWLHVAAFIAGGLLMCAPFGGFSASGPLLFSSSIALAAGIGRLAAWKLVRINDAGALSE
ncbi:hypothetical protein CQ020_16225 [Arthrobacter sp. MYb23]|uniref:hypothetical protein n=1 Tax=unclassified Arthrobacter TaxID=235627 RepID=UPI000CFBDC63|nr:MULTISPECIES: hypothetical protein [unclassified Arthrobacter]PRB40540.1 hypothetical protein CQ038_16435 [Arthrobacter sp. MYb51]PRB94061.1 hypothetical protein CQ020_16225 [Arthrobacter sp. MYb23]